MTGLQAQLQFETAVNRRSHAYYTLLKALFFTSKTLSQLSSPVQRPELPANASETAIQDLRDQITAAAFEPGTREKSSSSEGFDSGGFGPLTGGRGGGPTSADTDSLVNRGGGGSAWSSGSHFSLLRTGSHSTGSSSAQGDQVLVRSGGSVNGSGLEIGAAGAGHQHAPHMNIRPFLKRCAAGAGRTLASVLRVSRV